MSRASVNDDPIKAPTKAVEDTPRRAVDDIPSRVRVPASLQDLQPKFGRIDAGLDQVDEAVESAKAHIVSMQQEDGHWVGELEADGMLEADYIFLHTLLESQDEV